jgi:H-NS histone family
MARAHFAAIAQPPEGPDQRVAIGLSARVTTCGRICFNRQKINLSQVIAGQTVGIMQLFLGTRQLARRSDLDAERPRERAPKGAAKQNRKGQGSRFTREAKQARARLKRPVMYRKGDETWTGVGSQPSWVRQHLALVGTLEELSAQ